MLVFIFWRWASFVLSQIHKLFGEALKYQHSSKNYHTRSKKKRIAIVVLIMKVTSYFTSHFFWFPFVLFAKVVRNCFWFLISKTHSLSGKALKYRQENQQTKDARNSQGNASNTNVYFYSNKIPFQPSGEFIDVILQKWYGNYHLLSTNKCYIYWLFPNRQLSSDLHGSVLTDSEIKVMKRNPAIKKRIMTAFQMMLDFWGMELTENNQIIDSPMGHKRWKALNNNPNLAKYITRILKMFKDLDLQHINDAWLAYLSNLIFVRKELCNLESSFRNFWTPFQTNSFIYN